MDIDFALVLVVLVGFCGFIWLLDSLLLKKPRLSAVEEYLAKNQGSKESEQGQEAISELEREPIVVEYAKSFFPVLVIVLILRSFLMEPFQIPTGSMIPTMKVGDFILVNKYAYGLRLPVIGTKIMSVGDPERGDVMVFIPPHENKYFVKRVIGMPGDRIRYEDKTLFINGEEIPKTFVSDIEVERFGQMNPGSLYDEKIGDVVHHAQIINQLDDSRERSSWVVPNGHYFMMGDNRDNSADSRVWGYVSEDKIVGKAIAVWLHKDPGLNLPNFSNNRLIK